MPCCAVLVALLGFPRLALLLLWSSTDYLARAGLGAGWTLLGLVFLPWTTIAYAVAQNELGGLHGWGVAALAVGLLLDLGGPLGGRGSRRE